MKSLYLTIFLVTALVSHESHAEGVCNRCEKIREENAKKGPSPYKYYEDYLKAEKEGQVTPSQNNQGEGA